MRKLPILLALFALAFTVGHLVARAGQESAFILSGNFEDVFAGKHDSGGSFTVRAFESNALIDMTFENGFREVVGTDGHDTFTYDPFTGDRTKFPNPNGQATISHGRFPSDAHEVEQYLWLVFVHDPELITNLPTIRFPFYGNYGTNDIVLRVDTSSNPPNLITSIKWYVTNSILNYPDGWLLAEIAVTRTKPIGNVIVPSEVTYTQCGTRYITNTSQISELRAKRSPNDVLPVENLLFSITNFQADNPLSSYIPKILDKTARVNDKRAIGMGVVRVSSGKWWAVRELYKSRETNDNQ